MTKDKILREVEKREKKRAWRMRCLNVGICPDCGGHTTIELWDDGGKTCTCEDCGRVFEI